MNMIQNKTFQIEISTEALEKRLKDIFKASGEPCGPLLATTIIGNLETTEVGLKQLYLAFGGQEEKINFLPGDEVIVDASNVHSWYIDKESMTKAGLIVNGKIKAKVITINKYKKECVDIQYVRIKDSITPANEITQSILPKYLTRSEDCKIARPEVGDMI